MRAEEGQLPGMANTPLSPTAFPAGAQAMPPEGILQASPWPSLALQPEPWEDWEHTAEDPEHDRCTASSRCLLGRSPWPNVSLGLEDMTCQVPIHTGRPQSTRARGLPLATPGLLRRAGNSLYCAPGKLDTHPWAALHFLPGA